MLSMFLHRPRSPLPVPKHPQSNYEWLRDVHQEAELRQLGYEVACCGLQRLCDRKVITLAQLSDGVVNALEAYMLTHNVNI